MNTIDIHQQLKQIRADLETDFVKAKEGLDNIRANNYDV